jgi:hypothetical protein
LAAAVPRWQERGTHLGHSGFSSGVGQHKAHFVQHSAPTEGSATSAAMAYWFSGDGFFGLDTSHDNPINRGYSSRKRGDAREYFKHE